MQGWLVSSQMLIARTNRDRRQKAYQAASKIQRLVTRVCLWAELMRWAAGATCDPDANPEAQNKKRDDQAAMDVPGLLEAICAAQERERC